MKFIRIYAIFLRQMFLLRHNTTRFINIFLWITLDIILWGFITKYLETFKLQNPNLGFTLLGAIILWNFLIRIQQGLMLAFFEDVWSRNFLNLFASPLTVKEYIGGLISTSIVTSTLGLLFMLLFAGVAFGFNIFILGFYFLLFLIILFLFGLALGIFAAAIVLRLGPSAEWLAWPIPFILGPFSGVFYPISTLPAALQPLAKIIPPTYAFEGMRNIVASGNISITNLVIGIILALLYVICAYFFFVHIYKKVLRSGLITRFSAENF